MEETHSGDMTEEKAKLKRSSRMDILNTSPKRQKSENEDSGEGGRSSTVSADLKPERSISPFGAVDVAQANAKVAEVFLNNNQPQVTAADMNRMNRERGLEIVAMAGRFEALVDSASRSPAANMERNKIWHQITDEINKKYPQLNKLTFEQCKKLCKYYKRKDPANYGITLNPVPEDALDAKDSVPNSYDGHYEDPPDDSEILEANDIVDGICKEALAGELKKIVGNTHGEGIVRESDKPSEDLLAFISQCSASTSGNSSHDTFAANVPAPVSNLQKKERGQFVCDTALSFASVFESHSRSHQVNAERNQVWKQIADLTNEKYGEELGMLSVEQTKKLYANYKRKCQMNAQMGVKYPNLDEDVPKTNSFNGGSVMDGDSDASSSNSDLLTRMATTPSIQIRSSCSPALLSKAVNRDRPRSAPKITVKNGIVSRGYSPELSSVELLALLADRDAEIKQLKNKLLQNSVEHQLQITRIIERMSELIKTAVSANVQREIMNSMVGDAYNYASNIKRFDDETDL